MVKSFLSDKIEIRESNTHNKGLFAKEMIKKGEIVFIKGGHILKKDKIFSSGIINSYHPIDDEYYLGATNALEEEGVKLYINHSCNPNCGIRGEITFIALMDVNIDMELTIDYAFLDNEEYLFKCTCMENNCRKVVTGKDWKIKEIQHKYLQYFATYLREKIGNDNYNKS